MLKHTKDTGTEKSYCDGDFSIKSASHYSHMMNLVTNTSDKFQTITVTYRMDGLQDLVGGNCVKMVLAPQEDRFILMKPNLPGKNGAYGMSMGVIGSSQADKDAHAANIKKMELYTDPKFMEFIEKFCPTVKDKLSHLKGTNEFLWENSNFDKTDLDWNNGNVLSDYFTIADKTETKRGYKNAKGYRDGRWVIIAGSGIDFNRYKNGMLNGQKVELYTNGLKIVQDYENGKEVKKERFEWGKW